MAEVRQIVIEGDPILHEKSMEVRRFGASLHKLLDDMKATMYDAQGVGLAAPQIGISKRIIVIDDMEHGFIEMVNPVIIDAQGAEAGVEYCLSVPGRGGVVTRATKVKVKAQDRNGVPFTYDAEGFLARIFQHEIDHLHGLLFTDVMTREVRPEEEEDED